MRDTTLPAPITPTADTLPPVLSGLVAPLQSIASGALGALAALVREGMSPAGFVITPQALAGHAGLGEDAAAAIGKAYGSLCAAEGQEVAVTVRAWPAHGGAGPAIHLQGDGLVQGIPQALAKLPTEARAGAAVVVQPLVRADTCGRLVAGPGPRQVTVESCWGVEPLDAMDRFVVDAECLAIDAAQVVRKPRQVVATQPPSAFPTIGEEVDAERAESPSLTPEEAFALARLARDAGPKGSPAGLDFAFEWVGSGRRLRILAIHSVPSAPRAAAAPHVPHSRPIARPPRPARSLPVEAARTSTRILLEVPAGADIDPSAGCDGVLVEPEASATAFAARLARLAPAAGGPVLVRLPAGPAEATVAAARAVRQGAQRVPLERADLVLDAPSAATFRSLKRSLGEAGVVRSRDLRLWALVATPAGALTLDRYLGDGVDGIVVDLDALAAGLGLAAGEAVTGSGRLDAALARMLGHIVRACSGQEVPVVAAGAVAQDCVEALVRLGVTGLVARAGTLPLVRRAAAAAEGGAGPRPDARAHIPRPAPAPVPTPSGRRADAWWSGP